MSEFSISDQHKKFYKDKVWYTITTSFRELDLCFLDLREKLQEEDVPGARKLLHQMLGICRVMNFYGIERKLIQIQQHVYMPGGIGYTLTHVEKLKEEIDAIGIFLKEQRAYVNIMVLGTPDSGIEQIRSLINEVYKVNSIDYFNDADLTELILRQKMPDILIVLPDAVNSEFYKKLSVLKNKYIGTYIIYSSTEAHAVHNAVINILPADMVLNLSKILELI